MNIIVNKKYIITLVILICLAILVVIFLSIKIIKNSNIESFNNFNEHKKILKQVIDEKTSDSYLSNIPILNGKNPNIEIERKFSTYTPTDNDSDDEDQDSSVDLKKINKYQREIKDQNKPKENIIINKSIAEGSCKYISSYSSNPECPTNYNIYSGASMGIGDGQLSCNGQIVSNERAEGRAIIEDGSIKKIYITNSGNNYKKKPTISIIGDGKLASATCSLKNGSVSKIFITNAGKNYSYPPKVEFSKPDGMVYCHLCCQDLNTNF